MSQNETSLSIYPPEEEKQIARNAGDAPVGVRPNNRWVPARIATWPAITALGVLGWWMLAVMRGEHVNATWSVATTVYIYTIGYHFYALYIQRRIMRPDGTNATPAERINNGHDFDPTHRVVLYNHHFTIIADAGPLVGPVLAAQMDYLPGTLWIIIGVLVASAVQNMLILFFSMHRGGHSLSQMATGKIGRIGGIVMTVIVFIMLMVILAVLAMVCVNALAISPWGVFPVGITIPITIGMGLWLRFVWPGKITQVSFVGFSLLIAVIISGRWVAESSLGHYLHLSPKALVWAIIIYGFPAVVLPVWVLLTPRDYLSTFMKVGTIMILTLGIIIVHPLVEMSVVTELVFNTASPVFAGTLFPLPFITITCGALSGIHAMVSLGTSPKIVGKKTQVRMIDHSGTLMESFVTIMALAATVSLNSGIYFLMNTSTATMNKLAGSEAVTATPCKTTDDPEYHCEKLAEVAVGSLGVTDVQGREPIPEQDSWDNNGNPKTYTDTGALGRLASDVGKSNIVSHTDGAPTLSVGIAHILHQIGEGRAMMGFRYHFAIMSKTLFILSAVDAVTRVIRFQLPGTLGSAFPKLKDSSWHIGAWRTTTVVIASWRALLLMGITDPRGGIQMLYPLFGIASQLIAAMALLVVAVMMVRKGYTRQVWVLAIPLIFDTAVTFIASQQKIFSSDPLVGYLQRHREAVAELGTFTDPAKIEETRAIVRNTMIQGTLSIILLVMVAFVTVYALICIVRMLHNRDTTTSEDPYQEPNFYAPETVIASSLMKKVSRKYEQMGNPTLIPHETHTEKS